MAAEVVSTTAPPGENRYWRRNLAVCFGGAFTTIVAMTLLLPYLPLYVGQLGVTDRAAIVWWSGIAYSATFFTAALAAPVWGMLADRYGRKPMLVRASLGMAVSMSLIGVVGNVWQLVGLRFAVGLLGGYASGAMAMVAAQSPKAKTAWALGVLSAGIMAGNVVGPLAGGVLPHLIGIRNTFFVTGGLIFVAFLATVFLVKEDRPRRLTKSERSAAKITHPGAVAVLLATASLLMFATMSIEPIVTVYVQQLTADATYVSVIAGVIMAVAAVGSILSAPRLGKIADRAGHTRVIVGCLLAAGVLLVAQAAVTDAIQLGVLRFLLGVSLGGLLPCITAAIRHRVEDGSVGRVLGFGVSAQYVGQVLGPLTGGFVGAYVGLRPVFVATGLILLAGAALNYFLAVTSSASRRR